MGGLLLYTVGLRQCAEAHKACTRRKHGDSLVELGRQLLPTIVPSFPTGDDSHHHFLVHHTIRRERDCKTSRCILDVLDGCCSERNVARRSQGPAESNSVNVVLLSEQSL